MPQYDVYEDPLQLSSSHDLGGGHTDSQTGEPRPVLPNPLDRPGNPILKPGFPVENDGIYHIQPPTKDPFNMAMSSHTHARHSSLFREEPGSHLVPMTLTHSVSLDPSPKSLSAEERASLADYTKAESDNESIRLALACEKCGGDTDGEHVDDPEEFAKEAHMLNGGWMHRSRASCDLLVDRPVGETWETRDVEALRMRPRGAL